LTEQAPTDGLLALVDTALRPATERKTRGAARTILGAPGQVLCSADDRACVSRLASLSALAEPADLWCWTSRFAGAMLVHYHQEGVP
jgi:hypothetical protein